jgi:hypothetical protein
VTFLNYTIYIKTIVNGPDHMGNKEEGESASEICIPKSSRFGVKYIYMYKTSKTCPRWNVNNAETCSL